MEIEKVSGYINKNEKLYAFYHFRKNKKAKKVLGKNIEVHVLVIF